MSRIETISAVTVVVADMGRSLRFYDALGLERLYGDASASFTSYRVGEGYLNLALREGPVDVGEWGRTILYVDDVDAMHARIVEAGYTPEFEPSDAPWGERYFHARDPDGHELSFARPLR